MVRTVVRGRRMLVLVVSGVVLAGCGGAAAASSSATTATTHSPSSAPAAAPAPTPVTAAAAAVCPQSFQGQRVGLSGTIAATLAIGNHFVSSVKDGNGATCQLITMTDPGLVGAQITVSAFVAYVSPGRPPISQVAPADYAAQDK